MMGQTLGQYRILERLGEGGMGEVYRALDELLDREVALKMLRPELAHRADVLDRFRAEAVMLARLDHPNIARLYGLTKQDPHFFMVMEFVPGQTLLARIRSWAEAPASGSRSSRVRDAVDVMAGLLDGLEYAHQRGTVHRDVKPANVIVRPDGQVKITDFGIARVLGSERATRAGHIIGTLEYMAPEQIRGEEVDARADLYAAGIVFYELLSGRVPFTATTEYEIMRLQIEAPVPALRSVAPDLPGWCEDVIARALAKAPADRFASAAAFRDRLLELVAAEPVVAAADRPTRLAPAMPPTRLAAAPASETRVVSAPAPATRVPETVVGRSETVVGRPLRVGSVVGRGFSLGGTQLTWRHAVSLAAVLVMVVTVVGMWRGFGRAAAVTPPPPETRVSGGGAAVPTQSRLPLSDPIRETPAPIQPVLSEPPSAEKPRPSRPKPSEPSETPGSPAPVVPPPSLPQPPMPSEPSAPERIAPPASSAASVVERRPVAREPIEFGDIALLIVEGNKSRERDGILRLEAAGLSILDKKSHAVLRTMSYSTIGSATYSQSRHPRWKTASAGVALGGVFAVPLFFMKGTKHWLSLEGSSEFIVLRLDKDNFQSIVPEIQVRTGLTVARETQK